MISKMPSLAVGIIGGCDGGDAADKPSGPDTTRSAARGGATAGEGCPTEKEIEAVIGSPVERLKVGCSYESEGGNTHVSILITEPPTRVRCFT